MIQVLMVGVDGNKLNATDEVAAHAGCGITSSASNTDNFNVGDRLPGHGLFTSRPLYLSFFCHFILISSASG